MSFEYEVCIVGTGRVGLPLGLSFMDAGVKAVGIDIDSSIRDSVNRGVLPFEEPGYEALCANKEFKIYADNEVVKDSHVIMITVGTPLFGHMETDLQQVRNVLTGLKDYFREDQLICLRSTVAPGTTEYARRWIERNTEFTVGSNIMITFCPERIAEGKAYEELTTLPQIVGSEDEKSKNVAEKLFSHFRIEILHTNYISAELVKLYNNIERYVHFSMANQFTLIADIFDADIYEIRKLTNYKYARSKIATPGFTGGTCLRKDFGMLNEWNPYPDLLLSAWKMNEYMPMFLVQHMKKRTPLMDRKVAILGFSFKADTDDIRDSLAPKLYRYIQRELPLDIRVSDHHLPELINDADTGEIKNYSHEVALEDADCVFVATNHSNYRDILHTFAKSHADTWIADLWNVGGKDKIFYKAELLTTDTN